MSERPYHHGNLRQALVDEGVALLEEAGLTGLSLRAIAARAGVSHAAPKNHFGQLRGLLTAMAAEGFRRHVAFMRAGLRPRQRRGARLAAAMQGYVRFAQAHPHLFALMFSSAHCDFTDAELGAAASASYAVLREVATGLDWDKAGLPHAQLRAEMMLWSFVHGYAQLAINGRFETGPDASQPLLGVTAVVPALRYRTDAPQVDEATLSCGETPARPRPRRG